MESGFASAKYTAGQLNALVKMIRKQAGPDGVERFLRRELIVSELPRGWYEKDGLIRFSVTSDGTTREDWIGRLRDKGFFASSWDILNHVPFEPTTDVTYDLVALKGEGKTYGEIMDEAVKLGLSMPNQEAGCLTYNKFSGKEIIEMGFNALVAMPDLPKDYDGPHNFSKTVARWVKSENKIHRHMQSYPSLKCGNHGYVFVESTTN